MLYTINKRKFKFLQEFNPYFKRLPYQKAGYSLDKSKIKVGKSASFFCIFYEKGTNLEVEVSI